jgi:caa(3)-type oxidase subunit IV
MVMFLISVIGPEVTENKVLILLSAFGIAIVKAIIVAGWFMHLKWEKKYIWYAVCTSLAFMFLFVFAVAPDIMKPSGHNWKSNIVVKAEDGMPHHDDHSADHGEGHGHDAHGEHHDSAH